MDGRRGKTRAGRWALILGIVACGAFVVTFLLATQKPESVAGKIRQLPGQCPDAGYVSVALESGGSEVGRGPVDMVDVDGRCTMNFLIPAKAAVDYRLYVEWRIAETINDPQVRLPGPTLSDGHFGVDASEAPEIAKWTETWESNDRTQFALLVTGGAIDQAMDWSISANGSMVPDYSTVSEYSLQDVLATSQMYEEPTPDLDFVTPSTGSSEISLEVRGDEVALASRSDESGTCFGFIHNGDGDGWENDISQSAPGQNTCYASDVPYPTPNWYYPSP